MKLRTRIFDLAGERGYKSDRALAKAMGVSAALVSRVRHSQVAINETFIAGARRAFPDKSLDELFVFEPGPDFPEPVREEAVA